MESPASVGASLCIAGTYEENEYFSGNDVLISLEHYYKVRTWFSVTNDEFYFERMEIFEAESQP